MHTVTAKTESARIVQRFCCRYGAATTLQELVKLLRGRGYTPVLVRDEWPHEREYQMVRGDRAITVAMEHGV